MSCLVLLNTSMYKDCASFDEVNKILFSHYFVSKKIPNKIGEIDMKSSGQETQYPVNERALRSGEKKMMEGATVVVGVTQKLVIEFDEVRYQIWVELKATGEEPEVIRKFGPTAEESKKVVQPPEGNEPALIPPRIHENQEVMTPDLEFKGPTSSSFGKRIKQTPSGTRVSNNPMARRIDPALANLKRAKTHASYCCLV